MRTVRGSTMLVTGGAGFIGSAVVDALVGAGARSVAVLDDLSLGSEVNVRDDVELRRTDCADAGAVVAALAGRTFDACFNLAVIPLPASLEAPHTTVERNVAMTIVVCELVRTEAVGTLVQFSSSEIYGTVEDAVASEDDTPAPRTPYAASKSATDMIAASYHWTFGADVVLVRPFNTYGPRQNAGTYAGLIPTVFARVSAGDPVLVHGDGEQTRDYAYVDEIARGTLLAFERLPGDGRAVNIASGEERSVNAVVAATLDALGVADWPVRHVADRPGDVRRQRADVRRAIDELGFRHEVPFAEGIARTAAWYADDATLDRLHAS